MAKQKKTDTAAEVKKDESNIEKVELEPANKSADVKEKQENLSRAPLDEDNIPPLTSSKHVITLDNDQ